MPHVAFGVELLQYDWPQRPAWQYTVFAVMALEAWGLTHQLSSWHAPPFPRGFTQVGGKPRHNSDWSQNWLWQGDPSPTGLAHIPARQRLLVQYSLPGQGLRGSNVDPPVQTNPPVSHAVPFAPQWSFAHAGGVCFRSQYDSAGQVVPWAQGIGGENGAQFALSAAPSFPPLPMLMVSP